MRPASLVSSTAADKRGAVGGGALPPGLSDHPRVRSLTTSLTFSTQQQDGRLAQLGLSSLAQSLQPAGVCWDPV